MGLRSSVLCRFVPEILNLFIVRIISGETRRGLFKNYWRPFLPYSLEFNNVLQI